MRICYKHPVATNSIVTSNCIDHKVPPNKLIHAKTSSNQNKSIVLVVIRYFEALVQIPSTDKGPKIATTHFHIVEVEDKYKKNKKWETVKGKSVH